MFQRDYILRMIEMMGDLMRRVKELMDELAQMRLLDGASRKRCGLPLSALETLSAESLTELLSPAPRLFASELIYLRATALTAPWEESRMLRLKSLRLLLTLAQEGPLLQQDLLRFAEEKQDSSWLIDAWLQSYLACRGALPLVSNVGFAVEHQGRLNGIDGAARWLAAAAAVHADYLHGRIEAPQTPQGHEVCMRQWQVLQGALRVAQAALDLARSASSGGRR